MLPLDTGAPAFTLPDTISDRQVNFDGIRGSYGTLVMFICNHCPYVLHVAEKMTELGNAYLQKGIGVVTISANDIANYPEDSPNNMKLFADRYGFKFPYLYDESQETARSFDAACTPDFYLFDENDVLIYRGRLDDSRPESSLPVTGKDLSNAIDNLLSKRKQAVVQHPSMGCSIKWKT
jgi:peroxiredoxin